MTVTKDQAQMLTTLAIACRPTGARRWDSAGVMAALERVRERSLPEVIMAVIRAASDRDVETPGVIPTPGSHWTERLAPEPWRPNVLAPSERCTVCSHSEPACRTRFHGDHEFRSAAMAAKEAEACDPEATRFVIAALKDELAHTPKRAPAPPGGLEGYADRNPDVRARVDALRANVPGLQEPQLRENEEGC